MNDIADARRGPRSTTRGDAGATARDRRCAASATSGGCTLLACAIAALAAAAHRLGGRRVVGGSLAVGIAYSLPPLRVSYRTWLAPLLLAVAYVPVPFALGAIAAGRALDAATRSSLGALGVLFLARIVLKDYRDRAGDALLRQADAAAPLRRRTATCAASLCALVAANVLLVVGARGRRVALALPLEALLLGDRRDAAAASSGRADAREEQVAIGLGARLGNGVLLCLLAWLVLGGEGATDTARATIVCGLAALFLGSTAALAARPERVVIGYKG